MIDRRGLFKLLPAAAVSLPALAKDAGAEAATVAVKDRPLIVFRLAEKLSGERLGQFCQNTRKSLDSHGFSDIPAVVLPAGVEMDVYSLPGVEPCSESEQSKCASSAGSR